MADEPSKLYTSHNPLLIAIFVVGLLPMFVIGLITHHPILIVGSLFAILINGAAYWIRLRKSVEIGPSGVVIRDGKEVKTLSWADIAVVRRVRGPLGSGYIEITTTADVEHELHQELASKRVLEHLQRFKPAVG